MKIQQKRIKSSLISLKNFSSVQQYVEQRHIMLLPHRALGVDEEVDDRADRDRARARVRALRTTAHKQRAAAGMCRIKPSGSVSVNTSGNERIGI